MNIRIETDSRNLTAISAADFQRLLQGVYGATALAEGPILIEWNPRDSEHPVRVTTVRGDAVLFRRDAA